MLKREGLIESWHDRKITAGSEVDNSIDEKVETAQVILLLVSPDFLASAYCYEREMQRAMKRHDEGSARVIPIILRPCDWRSAPFGKLLAAPKDGKPVTKWPDRDDAFLDIVQKIRAALPAAPKQPPRTAQIAPLPTALPPLGPRSSNLRLKKSFTDADRDAFLDDAFEYIARFFENSLKELQERNPGVEGRFKRIDARSFVATIYRHGTEVGRCAIAHGTSMGFGEGISYARDQSTIGHGFNELLSVEADEQSLFLKPMGIGMMYYSTRRQSNHLSVEGAAEYYWEMLMAPLQR
jgi:hypothetical protein